MGLDISSMHHAAEPWLAMNNMGASAPETSTQEIPVKDMNLSALYQLGDDPYIQAQQVIDSNPKAFKPPASPVPHAFPKLPAEMEMKARENTRMEKISSDDYQANFKKFAAEMDLAEAKGLRAKKNDQGTPAHIKALENMIGNIHDNYQKTYAKINQKAAEYMKDVNTAIGKISDLIKSGSEGKIKLHAYNYLDEMRVTLEKYTGFDTASDNPHFVNWANSNSPSLPIHTFAGDDSALGFWHEKLGDGFIVQRGSSGDIEILPDLKPIRNIFNSVIESAKNNTSNGYEWGDVNMSSQAFQSLQASIDSQKNTVNSSVSQLLERFRQDNSTFETFIQLLVQMTKDLHQYNLGYIQ
ncbi:IpaD/SipD/SspD family type III secretion system needle tip protein [Yersinia aldovae]|uniref:YspD n=1 Tax=Yersinia aldovae TaxID=29483 RepID=A0ABP1YXA3_YERAL|nr:IpaD/SipD/SspD family type III secretion system needle tip protein [Yersinia aldovae]CNK23021.1 YspD [Yersinia aldovae]CNL54405.1 YspD [Yersinia aldovae]